MKKILQFSERPVQTTVQSGGVLRKVATEVKVSEIKTPKIKKIIKEMSQALAKQHDGVAIAAPQIGYSLRIFIVSSKVLQGEFSKEGLSERGRRENERPTSTAGRDPALEDSPGKDLVFINPKISRLSRDKEWMPEGCLSVRWLYGKTFRSKKAKVAAYDEEGKKFERGGSGLLAQIFQHETDHLNGILFIDHAKEIKEDLPAHLQENQK